MILRSFASNQPYTLLAVPVTVVAAMLPLAFLEGISPVNSGFPADELFSHFYQDKFSLVLITGAFILTGAFFSNIIFNKHEFFNVPVYVPAMMYAMTGSVLCMIQLSLPVLAANLFVLAGLNKQLKIFRQTRVLAEYFECGFWYGMAAVFYPPYMALAAGLLVATIVTRAFHWREHVLPLVAFSVPFLYWLVWKYWNNQWDDLVLFRKVMSFDVNSFFLEFKWAEAIFLIFMVVIVIMALPRYLFLSDRASNKARSVKNIFLIMAGAMILATIVGYFLVLQWILLTALLPVTFIAGYWFTNYRYSLVAPLLFYTYCTAATIAVLEHYGLLP